MTAPRLRPDGKPMRALRVLGEATGPVYTSATYPEIRTPEEIMDCYEALLELVKFRLAKRIEQPRCFSRWMITDAGREALR